MSAEVEAKSIGEELAKIAVKAKVAPTQLRTLYSMARTKTVAELEAYVQYQIGRGVKGFPWEFGQSLLATLKKYEESRSTIIDILRYASMLYGYHLMKPRMDLKPKIEEAVKKKVRQYGFMGLDYDFRGELMEIRVRLKDLRGPPRYISEDVERHIRLNVEGASAIEPFKVWIMTERR